MARKNFARFARRRHSDSFCPPSISSLAPSLPCSCYSTLKMNVFSINVWFVKNEATGDRENRQNIYFLSMFSLSSNYSFHSHPESGLELDHKIHDQQINFLSPKVEPKLCPFTRIASNYIARPRIWKLFGKGVYFFRQKIPTMQSSANVGNHSPVFHLRTTRCLGITQFFVGIILAVLAGCEFSFSFYSYYYAQSGIFGTVLAFFTLVCTVCSLNFVTVLCSCCDKLPYSLV